MSQYGIEYNGNIDLDKRQPLYNSDGSVSTESSIGVSDGNGTEYLIPTVIKGQRLSEPDARAWFHKTGEHLGSRPTPKDSNGWNNWEGYANNIHLRQKEVYKGPSDYISKPYQPGSVKGLGNLSEYIVPEEQGLIDVSGISALPVKMGASALSGIQLAKGADLARKVSWAKEIARNKRDARVFGTGLGLGSLDAYDIMAKK